MLLPITLVTHLEVCLDEVPSLRRFYCTIIVIIQLLMKSPYSLQPNLVLSRGQQCEVLSFQVLGWRVAWLYTTNLLELHYYLNHGQY